MLNNTLPHGTRIAPHVSDLARKILWQKYTKNYKLEFNNQEIAHLKAQLEASELSAKINGVNFSRAQIDELIRQRRKGGLIEFETLGPYLIDYIDSNGLFTLDTLIPEDRVGIEIAIKMRRLFPHARIISLYDDMNATHAHERLDPIEFSTEAKVNFRKSLLGVFQEVGIVSLDANEKKHYLLIAESTKIQSAERMVDRLESFGNIIRNGNEIYFINEAADNPLYRKFQLRSKNNQWLCVALDAASFLAEENKRICHLVILPEYMKEQQDMVWEILRVLGIHPLDYHNIFYPVNDQPKKIAKVIWDRFKQAQTVSY